MTGVDRLSGAGSVGFNAAANHQDAGSVAGAAIGELGQRILAWVGASGGMGAAGAASLQQAGVEPSAFRPDPAELARGGDVYGLNDLAGRIAGQTGATPTQEGELRRALEDVARQAVVQLAGLSGAPGDRQVAGLRDALTAAVSGPSGGGADAVVARLEQAGALLAARNGN